MLLAALSGLLLAASFPKFGHPAFAWIAITPLIVAVALRVGSSSGRRRGAFRLGLVAGLIFFAAALYWLVPTMTLYGGLPTPIAVGLAGLLVAYLALYPGAFAVLVGAAVRRCGVRGIWLAPAFWVATEWARSWMLTGFPWVLLGSSQARVVPIVQVASVAGVYGLSLLVALVGAAAAAVALTRRRAHVLGAVGVLALVIAAAVLGTARVARGTLVATGRPLRVGLVQADVDETVKWSEAYREPILQQYLRLSRETIGRGARLVIWPESATPFFFEIESQFSQPIRELAAQSHTPFIVGTDEYTRQMEDGQLVATAYNSAVLVGADGLTHQTYRKMHLVPFGEYVPLKQFLFFAGPFVHAVADFAAGTTPTVFDVGAAGGQGRVSVAICYESVYPAISRAFVERGSELLAVITNDSWYGVTSAPYQHFDQGAIRAVEEGRYLVRSANSGISGVVDPYGRVSQQTALYQPAAVVADVRLLDDRTIYSQIGDLVAWLAAFVTGLAVVAFFRSSRLRSGGARRPADAFNGGPAA